MLHELTLGQTYVLLEDMALYVQRTNPFGGGDEDAADGGDRPSARDAPLRRFVDADQPGALEALHNSGLPLFPKVDVVSLEDMPARDQSFIRRLMGEPDGS